MPFGRPVVPEVMMVLPQARGSNGGEADARAPGCAMMSSSTITSRPSAATRCISARSATARRTPMIFIA